jgi:hypothetical protein
VGVPARDSVARDAKVANLDAVRPTDDEPAPRLVRDGHDCAGTRFSTGDDNEPCDAIVTVVES